MVPLKISINGWRAEIVNGATIRYLKTQVVSQTKMRVLQILADFKSYENNQNIGLVDGDLHGTDGPVNIERYPYQPDLAWDLLKAGQEIGYNISDDLSGKLQTGFAIAQMNSRYYRLCYLRIFELKECSDGFLS